jgi:hypothetical protein
MMASFKLDPQWEAAQAKALRDTTGAVTRSQQQMAATIAQRAREQARSNQVDVMSGWVNRNKRMDAVMQRGSEARRGTATVEDPVLGSRTVGNDSNYYWTRPDGSIVGTNTDTPPDYQWLATDDEALSFGVPSPPDEDQSSHPNPYRSSSSARSARFLRSSRRQRSLVRNLPFARSNTAAAWREGSWRAGWRIPSGACGWRWSASDQRREIW